MALIVAFAVILGFVLYELLPAKADTVFLYPSQCLGTWKNPLYAQGIPDIPGTGNSDLLNEYNSALYDGGMKELYCGNFEGKDASRGDVISAKVRVHWDITNKKKEVPDSVKGVSTSEGNSKQEGFFGIIPGRSVEYRNSPEPSVVSSTSPENSSPEPEKEPNPVPSPEEPTTFLFVKHARAQETEITEMPKIEEPEKETPDVSPAPSSEFPIESQTKAPEERFPETSPEPSSSEEFQESSPESSPETHAETSTLNTLPEPVIVSYEESELFEILYTLDGVMWVSLENINEYSWRNAEFSLPVTSWEDIKNLQIKIVNKPFLDSTVYAYLDGMTLSIEYGNYEDSSKTEKQEEIFSPIPSENIPKYSTIPSPATIPEKSPDKPKKKIFDDRARHTCSITPFSQEMYPDETMEFSLLLVPSRPGSDDEFDYGYMPEGIYAQADVARRNGNEIPLMIHVDKKSRPGSYNLTVIYGEKDGIEFIPNYCQVNVILK